MGARRLVDLIRGNKINLVINTCTGDKAPERDGFRISRATMMPALEAQHNLFRIQCRLRHGQLP